MIIRTQFIDLSSWFQALPATLSAACAALFQNTISSIGTLGTPLVIASALALMVSLTVSVNLSRNDFYNQELENDFIKIIEENNITPKDLYLEITESAYIENSKQMLQKVKILLA